MTTNATPRRCAGPSRRSFLTVGSLGFLGLGLDDWLRLRAATPSATPARGCILIWLAGGPSHLDTFDPKPDAPADLKGEFKTIATATPGLSFTEVFPKLARATNRLTLIRSMTSPEADHNRAAHHLLTGYRPSPALVYPGYGSVVAKMRESKQSALPSSIAVPDAPIFSTSGYLSSAYDPFSVQADPNQANFRVRNLTPPDRITLERLSRRREMVKALDAFALEAPPTALSASRDQFAENAYSLLTSGAAQAAFKLGDEKSAMRDRYGRTTVGQSCLLARRLIEAGASFVTVNDRGTGPLGWDTHVQNFPTIKNTLAPPLDQAASTLIEDLAERGLLDQTLVVIMGEFGRTPKINPNAGRDHHSRANSLIIAGAGIPGGLVIGRTDPRGESPVESPVTPADLAWVLYQRLGIDPEHKLLAPDGRPVRLVDAARPPKELML